MNYQGFASFNDIPPAYGKESEPFYDRGAGIPQLNANNMTIQDIYRTGFLFTQDHVKNYSNMAPTALKGIQSESELSKLFFSDENFKRVQRMIRQEVFKRTNGEFRLDIDQSQQDLFIVMRGIFLEYARFLPNQVVRQIKRLNQKVINETVPGILSSVRQYHSYLIEINKPLTTIQRPINASNGGRRGLPSVTKTFGF